MDKREFLMHYLTEGRSYQQISDGFNIPRPQITQWMEGGLEIRE